MEMAGIVLHQVLVMFLLLIVGIVATKTGLLTEKATRVFCNLLLTIVIPCTMISAYYQPFSSEKLYQLGLSFLLAIGFHFMAIGISRILVKKSENPKERMHRLGVVYSNCGFMGFPLLTAVVGSEGIFLGTAFVAMFNIFIWIEGVKTLTGEKLGLKKAFLNPGCIGVAIGLLLYFTQIPLPKPVADTVEYLASMNTPLAMVITGVFLSQVVPKELVRDIKVILVSIIKTLLVPLIFIGVLLLLRVPYWFEGAREVCIAITVCAACPTAGAIILIPASMGMDGSEGAKMLAVSTTLSIVTLPVIGYIISMIL